MTRHLPHWNPIETVSPEGLRNRAALVRGKLDDSGSCCRSLETAAEWIEHIEGENLRLRNELATAQSSYASSRTQYAEGDTDFAIPALARLARVVHAMRLGRTVEPPATEPDTRGRRSTEALMIGCHAGDQAVLHQTASTGRDGVEHRSPWRPTVWSIDGALQIVASWPAAFFDTLPLPDRNFSLDRRWLFKLKELDAGTAAVNIACIRYRMVERQEAEAGWAIVEEGRSPTAAPDTESFSDLCLMNMAKP